MLRESGNASDRERKGEREAKSEKERERAVRAFVRGEVRRDEARRTDLVRMPLRACVKTACCSMPDAPADMVFAERQPRDPSMARQPEHKMQSSTHHMHTHTGTGDAQGHTCAQAHRHTTQAHRHTGTQAHTCTLQHTVTQSHRHRGTQRHKHAHTGTYRHIQAHTGTYRRTVTQSHTRHTPGTHIHTHAYTGTHTGTDTQAHMHTGGKIQRSFPFSSAEVNHELTKTCPKVVSNID